MSSHKTHMSATKSQLVSLTHEVMKFFLLTPQFPCVMKNGKESPFISHPPVLSVLRLCSPVVIRLPGAYPVRESDQLLSLQLWALILTSTWKFKRMGRPGWSAPQWDGSQSPRYSGDHPRERSFHRRRSPGIPMKKACFLWRLQ